MILDGQVLGRPLISYKDTQSAIEALTGVVAGMTAYATDTTLTGYYTGSAWVWLSVTSGSYVPIVHDIAGAYHSTSGRTSGQVLQATGATTFGWSSSTLSISGNSTINGSLVGNITGGGTIATGGFTLTVPVTGIAVTGSGTADYVTRWTSTNAVSTGLLRDDGTTVGLGIAPNGTSRYNISWTNTATSGTIIGHQTTLAVSPSTTSSAGYAGGRFTAQSAAGNAQTLSGTIIGFDTRAYHNGNGALTNLIGFTISTGINSTTMTGSIANAFIGRFSSTNTSAAGGTITNMTGIEIGDITQGTSTNKALTTGKGLVNFGDAVTVTGWQDLTQCSVVGYSSQTSSVSLSKFTRNDANTNALGTVATWAHNSTGTAAAGFGIRHLWTLESSTTADQTAATEDVLWTDATHATRTVLKRGTTTGNATQSGYYGSWAHNAVSNTSITIIPNGTGDVASVGTFLFSVKDNTSGTTNGGVVVLNPGGGAVSLLSDSTDTLQITCAADGSVTIARSAGTHTFSVSIWGSWQ